MKKIALVFGLVVALSAGSAYADSRSHISRDGFGGYDVQTQDGNSSNQGRYAGVAAAANIVADGMARQDAYRYQAQLNQQQAGYNLLYQLIASGQLHVTQQGEHSDLVVDGISFTKRER